MLASRCAPSSRRPGCSRWTWSTGATSCAGSTAVTKTPTWPRCADDSWELTSDLLLAKSFPAGIRRVREHRALGHRTLLITGALDFVIEPFRTLFDDVVCAHMGDDDGELSGEMVEAPPTGEARALIMARLRPGTRPRPGRMRRLRRLDERPRPCCEAAGYPVAVNPETKLAALARKRGWLVEQWPRAAGYRRALLPFGPRLSQNQAPGGLRDI